MQVFNLEQIRRMVQVEDLFEPITQSFCDFSSQKLLASPINLLHFQNQADAHIKIAALKDCPYFSIKVATMFPGNTLQNIPANNGAIFLFSATTGEPVAVLHDEGVLTDLRTAAAGAVITNALAPEMASSIAVVGTGLQAYYQMIALYRLRGFKKLMIYGRNIDKANLLKENLKKELPDSVSIKTVTSIEEAVKSSEIIFTATTSQEPILHGKWLSSGQHITAIGADDKFKVELDADCFKYADKVYVDSIQLNKEYGDYSKAAEIFPSLVEKTTEFGKVFQDKSLLPQRNHISIAKLVGLGIQDLAAAILVFSKMKEPVC